MNRRLSSKLATIAKKQRRLDNRMQSEGVNRRLSLAWWRLERKAAVLTAGVV